MRKKGDRLIYLTYSTIDRFYESKVFRTLEGAKAYVKYRLGDHFDVGSSYAVDMFGIGKLVLRGGATWTELLGFDPNPPDPPEEPPDPEPDWMDAAWAEREKSDDEKGL